MKIYRVYLGVRTCELFLCFVVIVRVRDIMLTSLFSLFYVTGEFHRFLHLGGAFTIVIELPFAIVSFCSLYLGEEYLARWISEYLK